MDNREGGCTCGEVRYQMSGPPMFVNCCHCIDCQTETGSALGINAVIESDRIALLAGEPESVLTPSASGTGQTVRRCPSCKVALWSHYSGGGAVIAYLRVGTLDEPGSLAPGVHIFTRSKLPWMVLPDGVPAFEAYYRPKDLWPSESQKRWKAAQA